MNEKKSPLLSDIILILIEVITYRLVCTCSIQTSINISSYLLTELKDRFCLANVNITVKALVH